MHVHVHVCVYIDKHNGKVKGRSINKTTALVYHIQITINISPSSTIFWPQTHAHLSVPSTVLDVSKPHLIFYNLLPPLSSSLKASLPGSNFLSANYHQHQPFMENRRNETTAGDDNNRMVDYMLNNNPQPQQHIASGFCPSSTSLSFADVMQFADFGPKLALNQSKSSGAAEEEKEDDGIDPVYFLKFPVLNDKLQDDNHSLMMFPHDNNIVGDDEERFKRGLVMTNEETSKARKMIDEEGRVLENTSSVQLQFLGEDVEKNSQMGEAGKNKKKRPRTTKTSEEVESQRMTHIAVERNRRKQMNEHLRVLRSLMPGSYVQRGDQASIIGGAIEFVRELEQLLQCLESQKRRRIYGDAPPPPPRPIGDSANPMQQTQVPPPPPPFFNPMSSSASDDPMKLISEYDNGLIREETAESKSCLADVEVRVLGFDAMIKILCRRSPGQLIKTIAALEDLELNILHTNITTIEQTVLYSFNVKVASESSFTAEDIANAVQQIFSFIHADSNI